MVYLYSRFTWRNLWLWIVPSAAAMYGVLVGTGPLIATVQFVLWHLGARAVRHYRGLPVLAGALFLAGSVGLVAGSLLAGGTHRAQAAGAVDPHTEAPAP